MQSYKVKLNEMPVQRTRTGKVKLDAFGEELKSVQVLQSPEQKKDMLNHMNNVVRIFGEQPELFDTEEHQVGNDPRAYTVEQMVEDFQDRLKSWYAMSGNHLYKSFIDRHNFMVNMMVERLMDMRYIDEARYVLETYPIRLKESKQIEIYKSLQMNDLFELPGDDK